MLQEIFQKRERELKFEEPAMFKPLSYSSEFVSIRQPFVLSTDNARFHAKNIRAGSPDLFMSMVSTRDAILGSSIPKA